MTVSKMEIPSQVLNAIYTAASSHLMDMDDIQIEVKNKRFVCNHKNSSASGLFFFESPEYPELDGHSEKLPIYVKDIKTILSLVKKDKVVIEIGEGENVFKHEKLVKKFPQPANVQVTEKTPRFEVTTTIEVNPKNVESFVEAFKDIKEGDIKITSEDNFVQFEAVGDIRTTSLSFDGADVVSYKNDAPSKSGFDKQMLISVFDNVKKTGTYVIEMGDNCPLKLTQTVPEMGSLIIYIAPKIYDDE